MSIYDYLTCEYPLPVEGANDRKYQTKFADDPYLDTYKITKNCRLLRLYRTGTEKNPAYAAYPKSNDGMNRKARLLHFINKPPEFLAFHEEWREVNYRGWLYFYDMELNFLARFEEGMLKSLKQITEDEGYCYD